MNTIKIRDTDIDINSIESIKTYSNIQFLGHVYYLDIVMKSGYLHSFDFNDIYRRDQCYNELVQRWINV